MWSVGYGTAANNRLYPCTHPSHDGQATGSIQRPVTFGVSNRRTSRIVVRFIHFLLFSPQRYADKITPDPGTFSSEEKQ